jgi:aspartate racemase
LIESIIQENTATVRNIPQLPFIINMIKSQKKIPGVLGGLGPDATVDFMAKIISQTNAKCDQDHIRMVIDHNPRVPNRHAAISGVGTKVVGDALAQMAQGLEQLGADFIVMACNTAHAFQKDIEAAIDTPFISIIDVVMAELNSQWPQARNIGIMAAEGCLMAELYQKPLIQTGRNPIIWSANELEQFMSLVYRIKAGDPLDRIKSQMEKLAQALIEKGAEILIAGCTEIPLVLGEDALAVPLLSSTDILVSRTIDYAFGDLKLPEK